ncbi:unnamed protein product, partial [Closterium sp. NIES-64]
RGKPVLTNDWLSPRDADGHGTWCAGAAAGNPVKVKGGGQVSGNGAGSAHCGVQGLLDGWQRDMYATEPDIIAASIRAVADGVDVLLLSLGGASATAQPPKPGNAILKPDIISPGVDLVVAAPGNKPGDPGALARMSGTSWATPHLAGLAALIIQKYPNWTPGAGHVFPPAMLDPGLTYDARDRDYQNFLAGQDLTARKRKFPGAALSPLAVRNLNLPTHHSASPAGLPAGHPHRHQRTYTVTVTVDTPSNDFKYGFLVWADAQGHSVRSPLVVQPISR